MKHEDEEELHLKQTKCEPFNVLQDCNGMSSLSTKLDSKEVFLGSSPAVSRWVNNRNCEKKFIVSCPLCSVVYRGGNSAVNRLLLHSKKKHKECGLKLLDRIRLTYQILNKNHSKWVQI
jgi:hypothetical protein